MTHNDLDILGKWSLFCKFMIISWIKVFGVHEDLDRIVWLKYICVSVGSETATSETASVAG